MELLRRYFFLICHLLMVSAANSQGETMKWYFGNYAGLDFSTSPPTVLTNGALTTIEGCAALSDANGNLLMYTDGSTIYDQTHVSMANGTGLNGNSSSTQAGIILKRPGSSTIYYVFSQQGQNVTNGGCYYSVVDMSLAAGAGSVITKNTSLYQPSAEKLVATKHCNGIDYWIITRDANTNNFRTFLLTSAGISTAVVTSTAATGISGFNGTVGYLKVSPNGKKLANANFNGSFAYDLYDFDNSTGAISNVIQLGTGLSYGCEFSPDGTKFYGGPYMNGHVYQWDLCAGSPSAIVSSSYQVQGSSTSKGGYQLAADGKIYIQRISQATLAVINNPNTSGSGCNFVELGQSVSPKTGSYGLPNIITSGLVQPIPPFTHTVNNSFGCQTASFTPPPVVQNFTLVNCAASGYSLVGMQWNFGDPASGSANTSSVQSPAHAFTTLGTYTVSLIVYYSCGGGTDTVKQVVNINQPCISVTSTSITCASLGSATVAATGGIGPYSYTWIPTAQTSSVASGLSPGSYTLTVFDFGNNFTYTAMTVFTSLVPLTGNVAVSPSVSCFGAATGTGAVTNLAGGSGSQNYSWFNGTSTYTTATTNSLSAGIWSISVTDALTGCQIKQSFFISQPPAQNLILTSNTPSTCAGGSMELTGNNSGGSGSYTYTWNPGPSSATQTVVQQVAGNYVYTLNSTDANSCLTSKTINVVFIANPTIIVNNDTICPLKSGTLIASGASSYTWNNSVISSSYIHNPLVNSQYTVLGTALGCTSTATAWIIMHSVPVPQISSNSPICNGQSLQLNGGGGFGYMWSGPVSFTSSQQNPPITNASITASGVYNLTVTSVKGCTASAATNVTVNPTPTISAAGSTVCSNATLTLAGNSPAASTYLWAGPLGYTSNLQNPVIIHPGVSRSGNYNLTVTSAQGCTNTAVAHVTVTALPQPVITSDGPKCAGLNIQFSGAGGGSYSWTGPNGFISGIQNPILPLISMAAAGIYSLTVTAGPCVSFTTHTLVIYPLPVPTASSGIMPCETKKLALYATTINSVVSYYWNGPLNFNTTTKDPVIDSVKLSHSGMYILTVADQNGCIASSQISVTVLQNPVISASGATVCLNSPATITASGAASYLWTGPAFYQSGLQNALIPFVSIDRTGIYTVVATALNSCTATTQVNVHGRILPVPTLSVFPSTRVCINEMITMKGGGGETYKWYAPEDYTYSGPLISFSAKHSGYAGTYTLVAFDSVGCSNHTLTNVVLDPLPDGSIIGSLSGCAPFCGDYKFVSSNDTNISSVWSINNQQIQAQEFSYCFTYPGNYVATGKLANKSTGCANILTFTVDAHQKPEADFTFLPEHPVENNDEVSFINSSAGSEQTKWQWFFDASAEAQSGLTHASYTYSNAGLFPVVLVTTNKWNCNDTIIKTIKVEPDFNIYIPNAFTPNGDGRNDVFLPVTSTAKHYTLDIYDRWGQRVFYSTSVDSGWDGTLKGTEIRADVYNWKISLTSLDGHRKELQGHVTLVR